VRPRPDSPKVTTAEIEDEPEVYYEPQIAPKQVEKARSLVKEPAIALIVAGFLGLAFNLFMAGYGFVKEFATPSGTKSKERKAATQAATTPETKEKGAVDQGKDDKEHDRAAAVMAIFMLLCFSGACGMAIWAGFNMIKLRSYWLSVAGSFAVMPGACFCCLAGIPIGIWSLTVLLDPEVSSAFS
jgi:hypothetical protein